MPLLHVCTRLPHIALPLLLLLLLLLLRLSERLVRVNVDGVPGVHVPAVWGIQSVVVLRVHLGADGRRLLPQLHKCKEQAGSRQ